MLVLCFFFFNDTATTEIYTLSLHDALPILPSHWQGEAVAGNAIDQDAAWWAGFDDPLLGQLASQVLEANLDLQLAANRVQQSRAARGISAADRLPSVSATASGARARNSEVGLNDPSGNGGRRDKGLFQC